MPSYGQRNYAHEAPVNVTPHYSTEGELNNYESRAPHHYVHGPKQTHYSNQEAFMYQGPPPHETYDAYDRDYKADISKAVSYGHDETEWAHEYEATCGKRPYCARFSHMLSRDTREFIGHEAGFANGMSSNHLSTSYFIEPDSVVVHEDAIVARLHLHEHEYFNQNGMEFRAAHLDLHMALFQEGIMQVKIKATDEEERFSISNTGIGVSWDQIKVQQHLSDFVKILDDGILISGQDKVSYKVQFNPFRIVQYVNGHETIIVNDNDNLYYDAKDLGVHHAVPIHETMPQKNETNFSADLKPSFHFGGGKPTADIDTSMHFGKSNDAGPSVKKGKVVQGYSVGLDFTVNSTHMFGLPQRADNFRLEETGFDHPYRLFNQDRWQWSEEGKNSEPLYGSVPYIMGHSHQSDASIAWMNSAETFVFLNHGHHGEKTNNAFISEGNALEFYLLGAEGNPKKLQKKLAELTGYTSMPPLSSLGYHFSKWEDNSANRITERTHDFNHFGFPVDYFWFDSEYAQNYQYGEFDQKRFNQEDVMTMNDEVWRSGRRFVIAADPHIRASKDYFMYKEGLAKQGKAIDDHHISNLFIRDSSAKKAYEGESRAGKSVWVDFLNESACDYWKDLFHPSVFKGTNYMYGIWSDMNEPSVYKTKAHKQQVGMSMDATHMTANGDILQHRWIHNAYGALQQRATFQGLLRRDRGQQRPFQLSRSFFFGSQRYGTVGAGSNHAKFEDAELAVNMMLSLGISGIANSGADVPGYSGVPVDDLFVQFYQLGVYFPFFRANSEIGYEMREPWLQSPRVQRAILAAIKQRYAQSHYMYNLFYESTQTGLPIMRPMWMEFPQDGKTFDLSHQFMFGPHILVSPKVGTPSMENAITGGTTEVEVYLPPTTQWYDIYSKLEVATHDDVFIQHVGDTEQGTWVRGGSILPVLNFRESAESLLQAIEDPIRLEIYANTMGEHPEASGHLYLDDGENHNYRHHEKTQVRYEYDGTKISVTRSIGDEYLYSKAATKIIDQVMIFGVDQPPKKVLNKWAMQAQGQGEVEVNQVYVASTKMVHITHLRIPVDEGLFHNHTVDLLELVF